MFPKKDTNFDTIKQSSFYLQLLFEIVLTAANAIDATLRASANFLLFQKLFDRNLPLQCGSCQLEIGKCLARGDFLATWSKRYPHKNGLCLTAS